MKAALSRILFGAIDGLLFGVVIEVFRRTATPILLEYYLTRELQEASALGTTVPSVTRLIGGYLDIPLMSVMVFVVVIPIAWPVLKDLKCATIRWQICGVIGAVVLVLIHSLLNPFGHHLWLLGLKWRLLLSVVVVCFTNLIYGLALETIGAEKEQVNPLIQHSASTRSVLVCESRLAAKALMAAGLTTLTVCPRPRKYNDNASP